MGSLGLALALSILPLPPVWFVCNPDWALLFLIYWTMAIPERVGVGYAFFTGLFMDVLTGRQLGQHALAYSLVAYLSQRWHRQLRLSPVYQQMGAVLLMSFISQLLVFWTQNINAAKSFGWIYWLPSVSSTILWPLVLLGLRRVRRRYQIY